MEARTFVDAFALAVCRLVVEAPGPVLALLALDGRSTHLWYVPTLLSPTRFLSCPCVLLLFLTIAGVTLLLGVRQLNKLYGASCMALRQLCMCMQDGANVSLVASALAAPPFSDAQLSELRSLLVRSTACAQWSHSNPAPHPPKAVVWCFIVQSLSHYRVATSPSAAGGAGGAVVGSVVGDGESIDISLAPAGPGVGGAGQYLMFEPIGEEPRLKDDALVQLSEALKQLEDISRQAPSLLEAVESELLDLLTVEVGAPPACLWCVREPRLTPQHHTAQRSAQAAGTVVEQVLSLLLFMLTHNPSRAEHVVSIVTLCLPVAAQAHGGGAGNSQLPPKVRDYVHQLAR